MGPVDRWKDYRKTTGKLTWRLATEADLPRILEMRRTMERFLGEKQDLPPLFARPVLLTLVAEDESGEVVDGLYVEAKVEILKLNCTKEGFAETEGLQQDLHVWLKSLGFRFVNVVTTSKVNRAMATGLRAMGFGQVKSRFLHWMRKI